MKVDIHVSIADDHPMVARGICNMLRDYAYIIVDDVYESGKELQMGIKKRQPDVLLLDINMPYINGDILLPQIVSDYPLVSVLVITNIADPETVQSLMEKGAKGYLLKSTDQQTLVETIERVNKGKEYIDRRLRQSMHEYVIQKRKRAAVTPSLSRREKQILQLITEGYTNQQIAAELFLGQRTVETYRLNLMAKLEVKNMALLIRKAIEEKLV